MRDSHPQQQLQHHPSRDSLLSISTYTTYPSTMSTLTACTLGLTDSPLPPPKARRALIDPNAISDPPRRSADWNASPAPQLKERRSSLALRASMPTIVSESAYKTACSPPRTPGGPRRPTDRILLTPPSASRSKVESPLRRSAAGRRPSTPPPAPLIHLAPASVPRLREKFEADKQLKTRLSDSALPQATHETTPTKSLATSQIRRKPVPSAAAVAVVPSITIRQPSGSLASSNMKATAPSPDRLAVAQPVARTPAKDHRVHQPRVASPSRAQDALADEWEAELSRSAKQLQVGHETRQPHGRLEGARAQSVPALGQLNAGRSTRSRDDEWERSGLWDERREEGREAEDKARRQAGREIARPPAQPRIPIRAMSSGATSIHIGVRPRLHPDRYTDSVSRNQPDDQLPMPLFSPSPLGLPLGSPSARSSKTRERHTNSSTPSVPSSALLEKAKGEYEAWLARKSDRESGFGEGDGEGPSDFQPKNRQPAIPGQVEGLSHSEGYGNPQYMPAEYKERLQAQQEMMNRYMALGTSGYDMGTGSAPDSASAVTPNVADMYWAYGYPYPDALGWPSHHAGQADPGQADQPGWWDPYWYSMLMGQQIADSTKPADTHDADQLATPKDDKRKIAPTDIETQAQIDPLAAEYAA